MGGRGSRSSAKSPEKMSKTMKFSLSGGADELSDARVKKMDDATLLKKFDNEFEKELEAEDKRRTAEKEIKGADRYLSRVNSSTDKNDIEKVKKIKTTAQSIIKQQGLKESIHKANKNKIEKELKKRNLKTY